MFTIFAINSLSHTSSNLTQPGSDIPKFVEPIQNQTVAVGREAMFSCVVENLQTYKVSDYVYALKSQNPLSLPFSTENVLRK